MYGSTFGRIFFSEYPSVTYTDIITGFVVLGVLSTLSLAVSRLWLSPIAGFPGSKLAAVTFWYEFYYDWILTGKYYERIKEMHDEYGPIIRISPDELHIADASFYDQLYVSTAVRKSNGYPRFCQGTGFEGNTIRLSISHLRLRALLKLLPDLVALLIDHDMHRASIAPLKPFFSYAGISRIEPRIEACVLKLGQKLEELASVNANPTDPVIVNLTHAFNSYANDVISAVLFEDPSDFLSDPAFNAPWYQNVKRGLLAVPLFAHLPWLARAMTTPLIRFIMEKTTEWRIWDDRARREILNSKSRPAEEAKSRANTTVFDHLVHSDRTDTPYGIESCSRVAQLIQQVGTYNSGRTIETIVAFLSLDDDKRNILCEALRPVFAHSDSVRWKELEKIPYLSACIKEGLRLAIGNMLRGPRSSNQELYYNQWRIPKHTAVSMTTYWMHMDPEVFVNPYSFEPDRWLNASPYKLQEMKKHFVPFAKGSRPCLGQQ
ncbi:cytochrome P450 [Penicillium concentricum]|uniref:Cytochrome P450 n=1 Tax=Penicillium concentricum TaxID=293559 RepID=A0A9W9UT55_9EURO|nr:cytochrome P450 [Penicillium concentricum]KAJ5356412.1 cytochrome P450 [Penicillium concentricum]